MVEQVQIPHSVVAGKEPLPGELEIAGLAVNLVDGALYTKGYDGAVVRLNETIPIEDDNTLESSVNPTWAVEQGGKIRLRMSGAKLSFNPSTGRFAATSFAGAGSELTGFTAGQITGALGFEPVKKIGAALGPPATDLATVITLANNMRAALISCGIGS